MMNRRRFLARDVPAATLGLVAASKSAFSVISTGDKPMRSVYYEFGSIRLQNGSQVSRMLSWLEKRALPLFQKHHFGPMGFFTVDVGPNIPAVFFVLSYPSLAEMGTLWGNLDADPDYTAAVAELEKDEPAFYREDAMLLRATAFCPPLAPTPVGDPGHKIFELRIYESPTHRQLDYLHDRFAGGEIEIFHKSGIHPILYADTIFGPNLPNMAYLIPFESEAHREKAWAAFRSNPDWIRIRDESIRRGGEIVRNITNMLLVPASFSMIR
jgi:hypothetical protein